MTATNSACSAEWRDTLSLIPGYDCWRDAEGYHFDEREAGRVCEFFPLLLEHVIGECTGERFELERWERAIVGCLFGWRDDRGLRRYREMFLLIPRKNGKTSLAAGLGLFLLIGDEEQSAEVYNFAANREQAGILFDIAKQQVKRKEKLSEMLEVYATSIVVRGQKAFLKALSSKPRTKHGFNPHAIICDELHAFPSDDLITALRTGMGARRQPLIITLTTADFVNPESPCNRASDYAHKVRDGGIKDARYLPVIYEAQLEDDWTSPAVWAKANPNLGVTVSVEYLAHEAERAKADTTYQNEFLRLHLNVQTQQRNRMIPMDQWNACAGEPLTEEQFEGQTCIAGLDLAGTNDLAALVLLFQREKTYYCLPYFWLPEERAVKLERETTSGVPYLQWAREGWLTLTPGKILDYREIRAKLGELRQRFEIIDVAYDKWNATHLAHQLSYDDGFTVTEYPQTWMAFNEPTRALLTFISAGQLRHGGHPVLTWMASNVGAVRDKASNIKPDKSKPGEKVDGIVALIMALGRHMVAEIVDGSVPEPIFV